MHNATKPKVLHWLQVGKREGATHMLLVEDLLANETVPVYVTPDEDPSYKMNRFDQAHSMRIKAVFDLRTDFEQQLNRLYP